MNMKKLTESEAGAGQRASLGRGIPAILGVICIFAVLLGPALPLQASSGGSSGGVAPGAPGAPATWTPANKEGYGTAQGVESKVWYTLQDRA